MPAKPPDRIRNVALIGHRGSGKTSLCEAILFEAGAVNRLGKVEEGSTVGDFEEDEQERGMSIGASVASFEYDGRKINLIDTPGEPSFIADTLGALRVVDAAVVVVNAVSGVEVGTERLWDRAAEEGLPRLVFVNMLDRERADFFRTLDSLKAAFGPHVVATEIPIGSEHSTSGVIDLIDMKAFEYTGEDKGQSSEVPIPDELQARAEEYREKLMDEVAENSDELMERYLEGEEISHEEIVTALKKGVTEGHLFPVTCGVATKNLATNRLARGAGGGRALARHARSRQGARHRGRVRRGGEGPRRGSRRLRLQDHRRPLHGTHQPAARRPGRPAARTRTSSIPRAPRRSASASSPPRLARR